MGHFVFNPSFWQIYLFSAERGLKYNILFSWLKIVENAFSTQTDERPPDASTILCLLQQELNWKEEGRPTPRWEEYLQWKSAQK